MARKFVALCMAFCAITANLILWIDMPELVQGFAALTIAMILPGVLLVLWWQGGLDEQPAWWELPLLAVGSGIGLIVFVMLGLSYIPGGLSRFQVILTFDLLLLILSILAWRTTSASFALSKEAASQPKRTSFSLIWAVAVSVLLALLLLFRFVNLGYSDFQGDEAGAALRANEILIGYENALFFHTKGPAEILIPAVIYAMTERLTEESARIPFAIANFCGVLAILALGWRLFGLYAGWLAALLLALDGYLIAFGRILQYQSIVFLSVVLALLVLVQSLQSRSQLARRLYLVALLMATGLMAHYEAALAAIPALYLLLELGKRVGWLRLASALTGPLILGAALLALFYLPFVRHPQFADTLAYVLGYRIAGDSDPETLVEVIYRTTLYSTTYALSFLLLTAMAGATVALLRVRPRWLSWLSLVGLLSFLTALVIDPDLFVWNGRNLAGWLLLLLLSVLWLAGRLPWQERTIWLWFGGAMTIALFFTARPGTHVYGFFIPLALLVGLVAGKIVDALARRIGEQRTAASAVAFGLLLTALFAPYEYWIFVQHRVEALRTWSQSRLSLYWVPFDEPVENAIFGFPLRNGWKAAALLLTEGQLKKPFDTNARTAIAEWYTRGQGLCPRDDPESYILVNWVEPTLADEWQSIRQEVQSDYGLLAYASDDQARYAAFYIDDDVENPTPINVESADERFDELLGAKFWPENGHTANVPITNPTHLRFGTSIQLAGYNIERPSATQGEDLRLTLYWRALQPIERDYFVSVQLIDPQTFGKAAQRDGQPGCNRHPTSTWPVGDLIADTYYLTIFSDAAPGTYSLFITVYSDEGGLEVFDNSGTSLGTGAHLAPFSINAR